MGPLQEMLSTTERETIQFFFSELRDITEGVDQKQLLYMSSVLAHFALVSTATTSGISAPHTLVDVLDNFVLNSALHDDSYMMENAGAQCLLLTGFFSSQMRRRHNIRWYADLGAGFFMRASRLAEHNKRAELLEAVSNNFEPWRVTCSRLHEELRVKPYLITVQKQ